MFLQRHINFRYIMHIVLYEGKLLRKENVSVFIKTIGSTPLLKEKNVHMNIYKMKAQRPQLHATLEVLNSGRR